MRALVIHGQADLRLAELPTPQPGPGEVLLEIAFVGICGSDLHYYHEGRNGSFVVREPLIPGHELSARVSLDPSGQLSPGTPVVAHPATFGPEVPGEDRRRHLRAGGSYLGSASTWPHTQGAMAEYLVVRHDMIRVLPATVPLARAALAEPLAVALHGLANAGGVRGKDVLISGAGPIGLLTTFAATTMGAATVTVTDVLSGPLERAAAVGADRTIDVSSEELGQNVADIAIECSGVVAGISAVLEATRPSGTVVLQGMLAPGPHPVALAPAMQKELQLRGSFRFDDEITEAVDLLAGDARVERVITHTFGVQDAAEAFAVARDSQASGKVLVSPLG